MEESDATASPNNESPSETGDSDADLKFSSSDDSYSNISCSTVLHCMRSAFVH